MKNVFKKTLEDSTALPPPKLSERSAVDFPNAFSTASHVASESALRCPRQSAFRFFAGSLGPADASLGAGGRAGHFARHMAPTPGRNDAETRGEDSARDGTAALRSSWDTVGHRGPEILEGANPRKTRKPTRMSGDGEVPSGATRVDERASVVDDDDDAPRAKSRPFVRGCSEDASETSQLSNSSRHAEEPEDLTCPVTKMMFRDPVFVAGSGNTYERDAIETFWRTRRDRRDPLTNAHVKNANLFTNWTKRREVDAWLSRHPDQTPEGWPSRSVPPPLEERDARAKRRRNRTDRGNRGEDDDEADDFRRDGNNRFFNDAAFAKTFCAAVAAAALLSTAFLAATAPAPPPGFPQFPPGVVASTLKGSSMTGMPAPPAWYAAMKPVKPPSGSRVVARRGARGALEIIIPPLGAMRSDAVAELGFAATWSAFTGAWTVGAFRGPTPAVALFSLPFWGVSAHLGKAALAAATETTRVVFFPPSDSEIEQSAGDVPCPSVHKNSIDGTFRVSWEAFGRQVGHAGGSLLDLDGGEIVTRAYVNGVPQTGVELREGVKSHAVGRGLHPAEQAFVAELVAAALAEARDARRAAARGNGSKGEDSKGTLETASETASSRQKRDETFEPTTSPPSDLHPEPVAGPTRARL